jgi:hypothetical protein
MTNPDFNKQEQHFAALKSKYQVSDYKDSSPSSPLYFILRKIDLGIELIEFELDWLKEYELHPIRKLQAQKIPEAQRTAALIKLADEFSALKSKYHTYCHDEWTKDPLCFIVQKLDSKYPLNDSEINYLKTRYFIRTVGIAYAHRIDCFVRLKAKYKATQYQDSSFSSPLYLILKRLDAKKRLSEAEINWLESNKLLETLAIFQQHESVREVQFSRLKAKYQATKHPDSSVSSPLYQILQNLEAGEPLRGKPLSQSELNWLKEHDLTETFALIQEIEQKRHFAELKRQDKQFSRLKAKYQATKHPDSSVSSPLYQILQNLEAGEPLSESQLNWLKEHDLTETFALVQEIEQKRHFAELKRQYKATQYQDSSLSCHLYKVLKHIDVRKKLSESDINFLKKHQLTKTLTCAIDRYAASLKAKAESGNPLNPADIDWLKQNGCEKIITLAPKKHFATLKSKYEVSGYSDFSSSNQLYAILKKLDQGKRLDPKEFAWLDSKDLFKRESQIFTTYHKIEATFYEQEYKRTENKWNLASASSHWRSADQAKRALKLTDDMKFDKIKNNKLKSALSTTRGGAFRDRRELDKAENCALQAIEYFPKSHHPYTLMGALCYERGDYANGDIWFDKAIKRGALPRDQDAEIKRVIKRADKVERRNIMTYLLKKDSLRYKWVKKYIEALEKSKIARRQG